MAETDKDSAADPQPETPRGATEILFASATDAFGSALLVWILGGVAMSIAASFAGDMVPSLPPGFDGPEGSENHHAGQHNPWWHHVQASSFAVCYAIFFIHSLWTGFHGGGKGAGKRIARILSHIRENWFGLIVGNAITAWVAVLVLGLIPNFSPLRMLWHAVSDMVLPEIRETGRFVFGEAGWARLDSWFSWLEANQPKIEFWIIYLGGAFDDLGVPNFKTLGRWALRRMQKPLDCIPWRIPG